MHIDLVLVLVSVGIGFLVGLTGVGGGALMTPMLIIVGLSPSAAITSDLIAAVVMRPFGAAIHWRRHKVNTALVRYLCYGSVPAALFGTFVMHLMGSRQLAERRLDVVLGAALVVGALAMMMRAAPRTSLRTYSRTSSRMSLPTSSATPTGGASSRSRGATTRDALDEPGVVEAPVVVRRGLSVCVGAIGGFMVGLTSVGAGSLLLILLVTIYPRLRSDELVGTDLAQSVPLTLSASLGSLLFGHVDAALTLSLVIGSVPGVVAGSLLSSRSPTLVLRRVISAVVLMSGLKYLGLSNANLVPASALVLAGLAVALRRDRRACGPGPSSRIDRGRRRAFATRALREPVALSTVPRAADDEPQCPRL